MDPNACLRRFLEACDAHERTEAMDALDDLKEWLRKDGALPTIETLDWMVTAGWQPYLVRRTVGTDTY